MAGSLVVAVPAFAAAPDNDTYASRTVVGSLPFLDQIDTSEATTDADDAEANASCGAPVTEASVWYGFTASSDSALVVNAKAGFPAGIIVVTGSPGSFQIVTCGPEAVSFATSASVTYSILVFDYEPGGANGGPVDIVMEGTPPPPTIDLVVDRFGSFDARTGAATVRGTLTCTGGGSKTFVDVNLRQTVGRLILHGSGSTGEFQCDGTHEPWSAVVIAENGLFKGGRAASVTYAFACGSFECSDAFDEQTINLRK
jgi:hypothetical protein